jgi:hypothetical protein
MPLFTYSNLSPYSHRVIIILWDLQIFSCPTNGDATCVHLATSTAGRTSGTSMTSASGPLLSGARWSGDDLRRGLPPIPGLHSGWLDTAKMSEGVWRHSFQSEGSSGSAPEGETRFWNLHGLRAASPTVAPHRRGSIPMSRSCDSCEEIPMEAAPSLVGVEPSPL